MYGHPAAIRTVIAIRPSRRILTPFNATFQDVPHDSIDVDLFQGSNSMPLKKGIEFGLAN
jgi:hypothetical protein